MTSGDKISCGDNITCKPGFVGTCMMDFPVDNGRGCQWGITPVSKRLKISHLVSKLFEIMLVSKQ